MKQALNIFLLIILSFPYPSFEWSRSSHVFLSPFSRLGVDPLSNQIARIYSDASTQDVRLLNQRARNLLSSHLRTITEQILVKEEGWYVECQNAGTERHYRIHFNGKAEPISREEFLSKLLLVPEDALFEIFDIRVKPKSTVPTWSWKDFAALTEIDEREQLSRRIEKIREQVLAKLKSGEIKDENHPLIKEWLSLEEEWKKKFEGKERSATLCFIHADSLRHFESIFKATKEIAFRKMDEVPKDSELGRKLERVKEEWDEYSIYVDEGSGPELKNTFLGLDGKKILIHPKLWERILNYPGHLLAEITIRAILRDQEGSETEDNFKIAQLFPERNLFPEWNLLKIEKQAREKREYGKSTPPQYDLARILKPSTREEAQIFAFMARQDPSALFDPNPSVEDKEWYCFFNRMSELIETEGHFEYRGLRRIEEETRSALKLRIPSHEKRIKYEAALDEMIQKLTFLRKFVLEQFNQLTPDSFSERQWVWLSQLDLDIRNAVLTNRSFGDNRLHNRIIGDVLKKLQGKVADEETVLLWDAAKSDRYASLQLANVYEAYCSLRGSREFNRDQYGGDFFHEAALANIELIYDIPAGYDLSLETVKQIRAEAMQYLKAAIQKLPKPLVWKSKSRIIIKIQFVPIPEDLEGKIDPQLAIAHYRGGFINEINLTMIGFPQKEQLKNVVTALIHELMHKLSFSGSPKGEDLLPISDFQDLCRISGFTYYYDENIPFNWYKRHPISEIRWRSERLRLGYLNHVWQDRDGRFFSYIPDDILNDKENQAIQTAIEQLKRNGVDVQPGGYTNHILASPEEVIAIVGSENEVNLEARSPHFNPQQRRELLQILQRSLLRSLHPVAERMNGEKIFEIYFPQGEQGLQTKWVDANGRIFDALSEAISGYPANEITLPLEIAI